MSTKKDFDAAEAERRARLILDNIAREVEAARAVLNENPGHPHRVSASGSLIAESAAMLWDTCEQTEPAGPSSMTKKVRKALGYTYP